VSRRIGASLTLKLAILVGVFVALPVMLYGPFEQGDRKMRELVARGIEQQSWLVAQALKPVLGGSAMPTPGVLDTILMNDAGDGAKLDLMFRPAKSRSGHGFYFVSSSTPGGARMIDTELDGLLAHGILASLSPSCSWDMASELRYIETGGKQEMLTWVLPIQSRWGCWVLVSSHPTSEFLNTSVGRSYWQTPQVRVAAAIYLVMAMLAALLAASVFRSVRNFRRAARAISDGRIRNHSFSSSNTIPELDSVAKDLDRLVVELYAAAREIREAAEDNAHSFKGPVATIDAALEPLRRLAAASEERARRSVALVDSSLGRLKTLIVAAQRVDNVTANLIEAPRASVNLSQVIHETLARYRALMAMRDIVLHHSIAENVIISAGSGALEAIIENLLDNAISVSPRCGAIAITLRRTRQRIDLWIEDQGPGIDPRKIGRIFERYVSLRSQEPQSAHAERADGAPARPRAHPHAGLGLWIVRRNVEALGGAVFVRNRVEGGLGVHIVLPLDRGRPLTVAPTPMADDGHNLITEDVRASR
jgi:two-component system, OmpR family, sensor histidine kinase ChvG